MAEKFFITTPIYYPNDVPHIGHAYTSIAADILARWNRLQGKDVFFLTGTDDHGKKILETAKKAGKSPKEFTDELIPKFKDAWKKLNISYDRFIRTTDPDHESVVQEVLKKCFEKGDIYKGEYEGLYCTGCEAYFTEKELVEGNCPIHKKPVETLKEESYFFRLSKYQDDLLKFYKENPKFLSPKHRSQEIINRVKEGLHDLSISRNSFDWGIPLPFDKTHITYVWFDALFNYYSATRESGKEKFWPTDVHIIGKDINWFHTVYWPAFLMSSGIDLPKQVYAHGWWTLDSEKISKSRGKVIGIDELIEIAGLDSARYFLFRQASFGEDGDFSKEMLIERHNNELANKLGNLISRVSSLTEKYGLEKTQDISLPAKWRNALENEEGEFKGKIVESKSEKDKLIGGSHWQIIKKKEGGIDVFETGENPKIAYEITEILVKKYMQEYKVDRALGMIFSFVDYCNWYIQLRKPWDKDSEDRRIVLYKLVESIREIAKLLEPFIPDTAQKIQKIFETTQIKKAPILFQKIEPKPNKQEIPNKSMENVSQIQFEDFAKLDLRVAQIKQVEEIEGADKLYKLTLDVGDLGERTICAGIKEFYASDKLENKKIIIIANLAPRKLRGIESKGMLLAASSLDKKKVSLISPDQDMEPGSTVG